MPLPPASIRLGWAPVCFGDPPTHPPLCRGGHLPPALTSTPSPPCSSLHHEELHFPAS